jgi:hypothetical protein
MLSKKHKGGKMKKAVCHPDRNFYCKDLCKKCYEHMMNKKRMKNPEFAKRNRIRAKKWREENPEKSFKTDSNKHLFRKFGITLDEYNIKLAAQGGVCKICKKDESFVSRGRKTRLAVDHCHNTGKIRGILCFRCNTSIAHFEQNPALLKSVKDYLWLNRL